MSLVLFSDQLAGNGVLHGTESYLTPTGYTTARLERREHVPHVL
jgi:hypothetical protein